LPCEYGGRPTGEQHAHNAMSRQCVLLFVT
jgi:hypothetical protein